MICHHFIRSILLFYRALVRCNDAFQLLFSLLQTILYAIQPLSLLFQIIFTSLQDRFWLHYPLSLKGVIILVFAPLQKTKRTCSSVFLPPPSRGGGFIKGYTKADAAQAEGCFLRNVILVVEKKNPSHGGGFLLTSFML